MRVRTIVAAAVAAALAAPALAQAQPNRHHVDASVAPGTVLNLTFGTVPRGEFHFGLRVSSDGAKDFRLTQKRDDGPRFLVLGGPATPEGACQGAAGSLFCTNITTPATPAGHSWNFRFRNRSNRPMNVALTVVWKRVTSAG